MSDPYYDPYDFDIDTDPYPVWRRLREEAPLYVNERYGFYVLSRFADVEQALVDWRTYTSTKGTMLEFIKAELPPMKGSIIFEDPPDHDVHRGILSRVFTPKKMAAIEPKVREFCAERLDRLVGSGGFDFIRDLGAQMPMRTIGMFLGVPEAEQEALRDVIDEGLRLDEGQPAEERLRRSAEAQATVLGGYIDWRTQHPSDDLMTEMLHAEFEDTEGNRRRLTRDEVLGFVMLLASAGNETTTRLIGWTGRLLADHPDQRAEIVADRSLIPKAIEEILRFEAPSPVQARVATTDVEHHGHVVPAGSIVLLLNGSANRDDRVFPNGDRFDIHRTTDHHLAFGFGVHFCLGAALARLEGRIALDEVLQRWPTWDVDEDHAIQARTSTVRGWERLPVLTA